MTSRPLVPRRFPQSPAVIPGPKRGSAVTLAQEPGMTLRLGQRIDDVARIDDIVRIDDVGAAHARTGVVRVKRASRADAASSSNLSDLRCQIARPRRANARPIARKSSAYQHQHVLLIRLSTDLSLVH